MRAFIKLLPFLIVVSLLVIARETFAQTPKREFRAVWSASAWNLDWPKTKGISSMSAQKSELISMLDELKAAGFNAILLQVRPNCDALYQSNYEPWSYWLTGSEGTAPNPFWDPLAFAIEEAHKRGMELHAWLNPYRAVTSSYTGIHSSHPAKKYPSWILTVGQDKIKILNPGLNEVVNYIVSVVNDIVSRYEVDGIVFDDYFYPYPPNQITNEDQATFASNSRGFTNIADWRRDNINRMIAAVYNKIQQTKPYVKFGVSPFGIWKNNYPTGITGMEAFSVIYCDALAWISSRTIDYLSPQLYWKIGGSQDYKALANWWAGEAKKKGRLFFPAKSLNSSYSTTELPNQINHDRTNIDIHGTIFYRSGQVVSDYLSLKSQLKSNLYVYKSLVPALSWKNSVPPNVPRNVILSVQSNFIQLSWDEPALASDNETARYYVIYRSETPNFSINDNRNILNIVYKTQRIYQDYSITSGKTYYYAVTAIDNYGNESSKSIEVTNSSKFEILWERSSAKGNLPSWFGDNTERGIAFVSNELLVVSRSGGNLKIRRINGSNGSDIGEMNISGISGGTFPLNDIETSWDGSILACNLTTDAKTSPFKIYRWTSVNSSPALYISYNSKSYRLGDNFSVYGNIATSAAIYVPVANSNVVLRWLIVNGSLQSQTPTEIVLQNHTLGFSPSVAPFSTSSTSNFYVNSNSTSATLFNSSGVSQGVISGSILPTASSTLKTFAVNSSRFLIAFQTNNTPNDPNGQNIRIIDVTNGPANLNSSNIYGVTPRLGNNSNSNATGDIAFTYANNSYIIYVLSTNNGIAAYRCKQAPLYTPTILASNDDFNLNEDLSFELYQNYPNPFNPITTIRFYLNSDDFVSLRVYDISGKLVAELVNEYLRSGFHEKVFDGSNLSSGIYIYALQRGSKIFAKKMQLLK